MIFIMINVNVNRNTKRNKKSIEPISGDSAGLKGMNLREAIKRVSITFYIGLGIARAISLIKDFLDQ